MADLLKLMGVWGPPVLANLKQIIPVAISAYVLFQKIKYDKQKMRNAEYVNNDCRKAALLQLIEDWGPPVLANLPGIIPVVMRAHAVFLKIEEDRHLKIEEDRQDMKNIESVETSMALLNEYKDNSHRLSEDPELERQLLEGLIILRDTITDHEATAQTAERLSLED